MNAQFLFRVLEYLKGREDTDRQTRKVADSICGLKAVPQSPAHYSEQTITPSAEARCPKYRE
jgi:hypothetical protein